MSDWWGCGGIAGNEGTCNTSDAANAGLDQEQPNPTRYGPALLAAVSTGTVSQVRLDDMVHRILRSLFASGLMDDPPAATGVDVNAGAAAAQQLAERSAVLLKNAGGVLPIDGSRTHRIAVLGAPANAAPAAPEGCVIQQSGVLVLCSSARVVAPAATDTPLLGLTDQAAGADVTYDDGSDIVRAAQVAKDSDVAIVYARDTEAEGHDRANLSLDGNADALIAAVAAANPRTVVVLMTGSSVTMPWLSKVPAVLEAWYPGERGGHAIARLLLGAVNPSGRLPLTFPASETDLPTAASPQQWPGDGTHIDYSEKLLIGYRWYDAKALRPLFPFGFGLSYGGHFEYSDIRITPADDASQLAVRDGHIRATVDFTVTNTGAATASETPQIYVGLPAAAGEPPGRLVAFSKVTLRPGESTVVRSTADDRALSYWNADVHAWQLAAGCYRIRAGSSSRDLPLAGSISVGAGKCGDAAGSSRARLPNTSGPGAPVSPAVWLIIFCPVCLLFAARLHCSRRS